MEKMNGSVKSKVLLMYVIIHYTQTEKVLNKILVIIFLKFSLFFGNIRWKKFILKQNRQCMATKRYFDLL